ncbi:MULTISPECIES: sensor histidine kinase [unclassified Tenacibaculum]|uniref:sensor histidine kinase n=1 Tax=unclassified Tenacibaculum TaxID=2635139 RepID=UPI001F3D37B9|nr:MULTISPECIES: histidine kinase [unclassified Tenacibaculum]MCF2876359.1 sensor histidine kinase [Tenacibaculum sp. Cn5-1]MCF2936498.1 sensor histidine kinase [Tenacibaculum sp. Cn5-34]MCG7512777.1 sensor histidine kinase [Tenacibaculum sp. Cn5-46]
MGKANKRLLIHSSIWLTFILFVGTQLYLDKGKVPLPFLARISLGIVFFYINYLVLVPKLLFKKKVFLYVIAVLLVVYLGALMYRSLDFSSYFESLSQNINLEAYKSFSIKSFAISVMFNIILVILGAVIKTYLAWTKNETDKKDIESQKRITELEVLKSQINPHFLFNSLNSIYSLTVKKADEAPEAVIMLSELMRYMLYQANDDFVLLEKEISYIENYVNLQKLRLIDKEGISLNVSGEITNQKIPPLLLISFIENAFKYGVDPIKNSKIIVTIDVDDTHFKFECVNVKNRKQIDDINSGIGLKNTKERLKLLYPNKHKLEISDKDNLYKVSLQLRIS